MKVKVKKKVLFDLLKKHLNENRTNNNPSGNFVFPLAVEEDLPIKQDNHMAMQYTVEAPPVDDPDYIPGSVVELKTAAARIAEEVPQDQIEYFYRELHKKLDDALDNHDNRYDTLYESINLLAESDTMRDFYLKKAVDDAGEWSDAQTIADDLKMEVPDYFIDDDPIDLAYEIQNMLDMKFTPTPSEPVVAQPEKSIAKPKVLRRKRRVVGSSGKVVDFKKSSPKLKAPPVSIDYTEEDIESIESRNSYNDSKNKAMWLSGYNIGIDIADGKTVEVPDNYLENEDFMLGRFRGLEDFKDGGIESLYDKDTGFNFSPITKTSRSGDYHRMVFDNDGKILGKLPSTSDMVKQMAKYEPEEKYKVLYLYTVSELLAVSSEIGSVYFEKHFTRDMDDDKAEVTMQTLNNVYGMSNNLNFSKNALRNKKTMTVDKMKSLISRFMKGHASVDNGYGLIISSAAAANNLDKDQAIEMISTILSQDFADHREKSDLIADDKFLGKFLEKLFTIVSKQKAFNKGKGYGNISQVFMNNADLNEFEPMVQAAIKSIDKFKSENQYNLKIKKQKDPEGSRSDENVEKIIRTYFSDMFDKAQQYQLDKAPKEDKLSVPGLESEIEETETKDVYEKRLERLKDTNEYDILAPFYDFSGASGLRQWFLKFPERKMKMFMTSLVRGDREGFFTLHQETFEYMLGELADPIKELAEQYETDTTGIGDILKKSAAQIVDANDSFNDTGELSGLETLGGQLVRIVHGSLYKGIMSEFDRDWTGVITDEIEARVPGVDAKKAKGLAEYWTGKKEQPDYETMTKAAKNLLKFKIGPEIYAEIAKESNDWFEDAVVTEFGVTKLDDGSKYTGSYREKILKIAADIFKNKNKFKKVILSAIQELITESGGRQLEKYYSEYEQNK